MKFLCSFYFAAALFTTAALAETPAPSVTTPAAPSHHKKAKPAHTLRHKVKTHHARRHGTKAPVPTATQPEAPAPAASPSVTIPRV